jgi:uncharacterized damage-inducible protein DinB
MAYKPTPRQAEQLRDFLLTCLKEEVSLTKKLIEAIPPDRLDWKPNPKGRSARELATHLCGSRLWFSSGLSKKDFAAAEVSVAKAEDVPGLAQAFAKSATKAAATFKRISPKDLAAVVPFFDMAKSPGVVYVQWCLLHEVHHRGQLSNLLRAMGAKVPGIYGPSADEETVPEPTAAAVS